MQATQQAQQQAQQRVTETANNEVDAFSKDAKNEFYRDVREDMADLLDLAAKRGYEMTLKDAYDRACAARPDIAGVIAARGAAVDHVKKRVASKSITGAPSGTTVASEASSLRESIASAWENSGRV